MLDGVGDVRVTGRAVGAEGAEGKVYADEVAFHKQVADLTGLKRPHTQIMLNLGNPELAFQVSQIPCDGVGLARMEFIINEHIKVHPMAVLHPERITDAAERARVQALSARYADGASYFIERLAEGVGTIAAASTKRAACWRRWPATASRAGRAGWRCM